MKFYDRESEIATLNSFEQASSETAQMTIIQTKIFGCIYFIYYLCMFLKFLDYYHIC